MGLSPGRGTCTASPIVCNSTMAINTSGFLNRSKNESMKIAQPTRFYRETHEITANHHAAKRGVLILTTENSKTDDSQLITQQVLMSANSILCLLARRTTMPNTPGQRAIEF